MLSVVIIEDEVAAFHHLQKLLVEASSDIKVDKHLRSVQEAVAWLQQHTLPDLLFMDIRLSDGLSFSILEQCFVDCPIIFTTAYDEYALQAFKTNGIDYLLKPITATDLQRALDKYQQLINRPTDWQYQHLLLSQHLQRETAPVYRERFLLKKGKDLIPMQSANIAYFYRAELVFAVTKKGGRYIVEYSLSELQRQLSPQLFVRLNRTHLVQLDAIQKLRPGKPGQLVVQLEPLLDNPIELSVQRSRYLRKILQGNLE